MDGALAIGIDLGTSGARAVAMRSDHEIIAEGACSYAQTGSDLRSPASWWRAVHDALQDVLSGIERGSVRALSVDGTSGTILPVDSTGQPVAAPMMYNDPVADDEIVARIEAVAPAASAAHGTTSGLAKALVLQDEPGTHILLHQADWITGQFTGQFTTTDENNALKTGYDPVSGTWPAWISQTGLKTSLLPRVRCPGDVLGRISERAAQLFDLPDGVIIAAGTTDGCASFLATGADQPGDGVTALGSTLTLKLLCESPVFAPEYGVYSHRINGLWLAGGASNTGGAVLAHDFSLQDLEALSKCIDPATSSGLDYYPLLKPGERFPIRDEHLQPRLQPRSDDDAQYLKGMLEGIAEIERQGYARLATLGAPALRTVRSVGGGAANRTWTAIRQRKLGVPLRFRCVDSGRSRAARLAWMALERSS